MNEQKLNIYNKANQSLIDHVTKCAKIKDVTFERAFSDMQREAPELITRIEILKQDLLKG